MYISEIILLLGGLGIFILFIICLLFEMDLGVFSYIKESISDAMKRRKEKKHEKEVMSIKKYICCVLALVSYYIIKKIDNIEEEDK